MNTYKNFQSSKLQKEHLLKQSCKNISTVAHFTCERVFLKRAASKNKRTLTTADVDILWVLRQHQIQCLPNI